jgi:subtilisin family serine protease
MVTVQAVLSAMEKGRYGEGELLVKFKTGVLSSSSLRTHQSIGATSLRKFSLVPNLEHVKLPEGLSVKDAIITYMNDPNVEYAEPNYIKHSSATTPNDPLFNQQWALNNIQAPQAWDIARGSSAVVVAVIDTGADYTHPDLSQNIWANPGESCTDGLDHDGNGFINDCRGWDFTTCARFNPTTGVCSAPKSPGNNPMDNNGHGTHVSGIAGAVGNNATGVAGLNWSVQIMPLKILNADGEGTIADEIAAIGYVVKMKNMGANIKVMNASFSGPDFSNSELLAISQANSAGVLLAAAAGNDGANNDQTPNYPANYSLPNIISVAATDQSDNLAFFSNFGLNSVHVAAPGLNILSTIPFNLPPCTITPFQPNYDYCSGTSMATPYVSGLAGLLYSHYTGFTPSQIRGTIFRYVDVLPTLSGRMQTGGRINAYLALSSLLAPTGLTATFAPSSQVTLSWTDNATGEDGYKVERRTGGGSYNQIVTLAAGASAYTDSGLAEGTAFTYRVRAFNALPNPPGITPVEGDSVYSNEASVTTPLNPPTGLSAKAVSTTQVALAWTDNSQAEDGYKIERMSQGGAFVQIASTGPNTTTFADSGLTSNTTYTYRVRAFNAAAGDSQYSNEASATTPAEQGQSGGSGGGGCSIGAKQNAPTAAADFAVLLMPLLIFALWRRRG